MLIEIFKVLPGIMIATVLLLVFQWVARSVFWRWFGRDWAINYHHGRSVTMVHFSVTEIDDIQPAYTSFAKAATISPLSEYNLGSCPKVTWERAGTVRVTAKNYRGGIIVDQVWDNLEEPFVFKEGYRTHYIYLGVGISRLEELRAQHEYDKMIPIEGINLPRQVGFFPWSV